MSKRFTVRPLPEVIDLTQDEEDGFVEEYVGFEVPEPQPDQERGTIPPRLATEPQNLFQAFPPTKGRRPVQLLVAEPPLPEQQQQQQQQQIPRPQPGPSGVEKRYVTENYSSAESEVDTDSDNPYVNLGQGRKCHISRWVKYVNNMDFDIYGPDAMTEYFSDSEAEEAKHAPEAGKDKKK